MPEITAFCGLRYNTSRIGRDLSTLIAPPYDVLEAEDKAALLAQNDHNIVAVDLPHVPPKSAGPDEVYADAARRLEQWRNDETVIPDNKPAIYVYHQIYRHAGHEFTRRMFLARMRLEHFGTGTVFPHEQTFGGPKEDRLKLMRATQCQLSPIFGLYNDPKNEISKLLDLTDIKPDVTAKMQDVINRLWVLQDTGTIRAVCRQFADRAVYIADGHHRYGTALTYLDALLAQQGNLPPNHATRFVLVGLCAMEDPGCVILPTHRVLNKFGQARPDELLAAMKPGLRLTPADAGLTDPADLLPQNSPNDVAIYLPDGKRMYIGVFTNRKILDTLAPDQSNAWRSLDLAYLHRYLIDELIMANPPGGTAPKVHCVKSLEKTIELARETNGIAIITKACTMPELRDVSNAGDLMPQKSTFFYPKLATGLVINPLT